jgi:hypothetical protein
MAGGIVRTLRDAQELALEAANVLKACNPHSRVVVRDVLTGVTLEFGASNATGPKR